MPARAPRRAARSIAVLAIAMLLAAPLAGCGDISWAPPATPITGEGTMASEDRTAEPFDRVSVSAPVKVAIGEAQQTEVKVDAQENVLPLLSTEVVDGQLVVSMVAPGFTTSDDNYPLVTVRAPGITSLAIAGGSIGILESTTGELRIDVSGQSVLTAIGQVPTVSLSMTQGAHAELAELLVKDATIKMTDGSAATMTISGSVTGVANGGSTLTLTQQPASQTVEVSGGGSVLVQ
jgi:Putative auto-transporter adhesin, head GIN domain